MTLPRRASTVTGRRHSPTSEPEPVRLSLDTQDIDTSTPDGQSFFDFLDLMVEFEHALAGEKSRSWLP